jgi:hypothetical protein
MYNLFTTILGSIFIIISLHRLFYLSDNDKLIETNNMQLNPIFSNIIILAQLVVGSLLITNTSNTLVLQISLIGIIFNSILMLFHNYDNILKTYKEIWTFQPTAMSFSLHLLYIFIILILLYCNKTTISISNT